MVFYYTSKADQRYQLYVGRDKYENEDLIKYGWDCDVWFHVDDYSSPHVYVRCPDGVQWTSLPRAVIVEAAEITKAQSIEGSKQPKVQVIYTPWANLKKTRDMDTGSIGFHSARKVRRIGVEGKCRETERLYLRDRRDVSHPDLAREQRDHKREVEAAKSATKAGIEAESRREQAAERAAARQRSRMIHQASAVDPRARDNRFSAEAVKKREEAERAALAAQFESSDSDSGIDSEGPALF